METKVFKRAVYKTVPIHHGHIRCMLRDDGNLFIRKTELGVSRDIMSELFQYLENHRLELTWENIDEILVLLAKSGI